MRRLPLYTVVLVLVARSLAAQDPLLEDATSYSLLEGVSVDEALRRLRLQQEIGDLDAALHAEESATFAGLWIEHKPQYRIVARFTDPAAEERLRARVAEGALAELVETRSARFSLQELRTRRQELRAALTRAGVAFNSDIDIVENRIEIYVREAKTLDVVLSGVSLGDGVVVQRVSALSKPEALVGGVKLASCTSGFTVQGADGALGVSTAGHCHDQQTFGAVQLQYRNGRFGDQYDVQWHSACDLVEVTNQFESGLGLRSCTATRHRDQQARGTFVCKHGITTGRTCGKIDSTSFDPGSGFSDTFVRVDGDEYNVDLSRDGDSGGPWFVDGIAYGIHHGSPTVSFRDAVYMPINYISGIGATVLTANPGACNLLPKPSFTWIRRVEGVFFDGSGSFDPDGSIVRWEWNFDDGTRAVSTTPTITHPYPRESRSYYVTLTVTDNEGKRASTIKEVALCYPIDCREY